MQTRNLSDVELQERGALPIHVAVTGRHVYHLIRAIWLSIVGVEKNPHGSARPIGNVHVRNSNDVRNGKKHNRELQHLIAGYLRKYITKDMHDHI